MTTSRTAVWGFIAAGLMNVVGVLIFSGGFTNDELVALSPNVFSRFGLLMIIVWGLAYISVARSYRAVPALVLVFALEKAIYVATWFIWLSNHGGEFSSIYARDPKTAIFYAIYGPNDLIFGLFFAYVGFKAWIEKV
jgi:hypothetical protein